jgi:uncharacterized damage-inducible protein DinB
MRRSLCSAAALVLAAFLVQPVTAQHGNPPAVAPAKADAKPSVAGVRGEILRQVDAARDKLVALAEATPADKFAWRPNDKVRTVGEVYAHVAGGNYFLPTLWGVKFPDGVDPRGLEKEGADKAKTIASLKNSFEHVHHVIESGSDADLYKPLKLEGHEGTLLEGYLLIATHAHEHLGQSIAYARSIGIAPPWSR